jgi:predicted aldo/keto reductase-like oxidoreductase
MESNYKKYERMNLWGYVRELKRDGLVRHLGFSFHGGQAFGRATYQAS